MQTLIDVPNANSDPARAAPLRCAFGVPRQTLVALELAQFRRFWRLWMLFQIRAIGARGTPPLSCGLLDGIARAHARSEGRVVEAVVRVDDLPRATGLAFVNSLRGWLPAVLI